MGNKGIALALAALLAVTACGGDDDTAAKPTVPPKPASASRLLELADIQTTDALDARWEVRDVQEGVDIELPPCIDEEAHAERNTARVNLTAVGDLHLPSLDEQVTGYADAGGAHDGFAAAVARLDTCDARFVFEGTPSQGAIAPLDLGTSLGDESKAWRTTVTIAGAAVNVTTIQIRKGEFVASLVYTDIAQTDLAAVVGYATKAAAKM
jgi:hypothetical protein